MPDVSGNGQPAPAPPPGLPPVVAPSGRFIAQLFLVPGLIVAGAVVVLLGFSWLAGGNRSPQAFLRDLDSSNIDIRKRTASDLAQVLKRDDGLATNVDFGLQLVTRLRQAAGELDRADAASASESTAGRTEDQNRRWYVQFLIASVGNLMTPVGGPVLADLARTGAGRDPKVNATIRRQAVWALAALGEALQRFDKLPEERKAAVLEALDRAADGAPGESAAWARKAAAALRKQAPLGVVAALAECANADDPFLRQQVALALTFWGGTPEEDRLAKATLLKLAHDDGHGTAIQVEKDQ
ncbi:MAG TPA: hypothetical protein VGF55_17890 [Gemmataceae bacterium]|jgi:hypothetical protein